MQSYDRNTRCLLTLYQLQMNFPQKEGIKIVCQYYDEHYQASPAILISIHGDLIKLMLKENSFHFDGKHLLQTHGIAMAQIWQ